MLYEKPLKIVQRHQLVSWINSPPPLEHVECVRRAVEPAKDK